MNATQFQLSISEKRQAVNALLAKLELTEAEATELKKLESEYQELEARYQTFLKVNPEKPEPLAVDPQHRELEQRARLSDVFRSAVSGQQPVGATRELQQELKLNANQIPLTLLETRAITPAPDATARIEEPTISALFPLSVASFLGISMPTVSAGEHSYPVMTESSVPAVVAESASVAETTGSFSATSIAPTRAQKSFFYSREDAARFANMDMALRQNLSDALSSAIDKHILTKASNGGLLNFGSTLTEATTTDYAKFKSKIVAGVDGIHANAARDLRMVVGDRTYVFGEAWYRTEQSEESAIEWAERRTGGIRVSGHVPTPSSDVQQGIIAKGMAMNAVAPIWNGVELITDNVTQAKKGQIVLTAVALIGFQILRTGGFLRFAVNLT